MTNKDTVNAELSGLNNPFSGFLRSSRASRVSEKSYRYLMLIIIFINTFVVFQKVHKSDERVERFLTRTNLAGG